MRYSSDFCVIGGGIAGLTLARALGRSGATVVVVDRGAVGQGAGFAAAGMLAPYVEARLDEVDLGRFGREALGYYPGFVAEVEQESGIGLDYRSEGTLIVAVDRDDHARIRHLFQEQQDLGLPVEWLSGYDCRTLEPMLAPNVPGGIFSSDDHQVDNRALLRALRTWCDASPSVTLLENMGMGTFHVESGGVGRPVGYMLADDEILSGEYVICTGAHADLLATVDPALARVLHPVKGQIIRLDQRKMHLLDHLVRTPRVYLAPKSDGTLVVGASVEEKGFDESITAGEVYELLRAARECLPSIHELPILETRAGFRPATIDHLPMLGSAGVDGLWLAMGYYRHGILFSPFAAATLAARLLHGIESPWLEHFNPLRFHATATQRTAP